MFLCMLTYVYVWGRICSILQDLSFNDWKIFPVVNA